MRHFYLTFLDQRLLKVICLVLRCHFLAKLLFYLRYGKSQACIVLLGVFSTRPRCIESCDNFIDTGKIPRDSLGQILDIYCVILGLHIQKLLFFIIQDIFALILTLLISESLISFKDTNFATTRLYNITICVYTKLLQALIFLAHRPERTMFNELFRTQLHLLHKVQLSNLTETVSVLI